MTDPAAYDARFVNWLDPVKGPYKAAKGSFIYAYTNTNLAVKPNPVAMIAITH